MAHKHVSIKVYDAYSLDSALRTFKTQVNKSGILTNMREHEFYVSKSKKLREAKKVAIRKARKHNHEDKKDLVKMEMIEIYNR